MRGDAINRASTFFNQPCFTLLLNALQCRLFANSDDGEAAIIRCGNRFCFMRAPFPFHACAVSVSRVRRFRFTRAPLPFHVCAVSVSRVRRFRFMYADRTLHSLPDL